MIICKQILTFSENYLKVAGIYMIPILFTKISNLIIPNLILLIV